MGEVDEDFAWAGLGGGQLFDFGGDGAGVVVDDGFVRLGDFNVGHGGGEFEIEGLADKRQTVKESIEE